MSTVEHKGIVFEIPDGWTDRTVLAFTAPKGDDDEYVPSLVMTREALEETESLRTHFDKTLLDMSKQLQQFDLLESRETTIAGMPALYVRFAWVSHMGELQQEMTMVEAPSVPGETKRNAVLVTATVQRQDVPRVQQTFAQIVGSLRFAQGPHGPSGPPPGMVPPPVRPPPPPPPGTDPNMPVFGLRNRR
jgi:hypothetical protein